MRCDSGDCTVACRMEPSLTLRFGCTHSVTTKGTALPVDIWTRYRMTLCSSGSMDHVKVPSGNTSGILSPEGSLRVNQATNPMPWACRMAFLRNLK